MALRWVTARPDLLVCDGQALGLLGIAKMGSVWGNVLAEIAKFGGSTGFRRAYLLCMVAVASLTLIGQFMTAGYARKTQKGQEALERARELRQLSEGLVADAMRLSLGKTHEERVKVKKKIEDRLDEWSSATKDLAEPGASMGLDAKQNANLVDDFEDLHNQFQTVDKLLPKLLHHPSGRTIQLLEVLDAIHADLDRVDDVVQKSFEEETKASRIVIVGVAFATLLVLMAEYVLVFRPKLLSMKATSLELANSNAQLESDNELIAAHNAKLEELNREITEIQERYADAARRMSDLFDGLPVAVFSFDRNGKIEEWNSAAEKLFGIHPMEATQKTMAEVLAGSLPEEQIEDWVRAPYEDRPIENALWKLSVEGGEKSISTSVFGVHGNDHRVFGAVCVHVDVTDRLEYEAQLEQSMLRINEYSLELEMQKNELEEANEKLEKLATTDGLTGLKNHRFFQELVEESILSVQTSGEPLSVLLMDVDHFKKFNDTFGHQAGDEVLKSISKVLAETQSPCFQPARYGGEEFVAVMPGLSEAEAFELAEIVRQRIELAKPAGHEVTASFGVASWDADVRGKGELVARADKALYASKAGGRNRVTKASSLWSDEGAAKAA